MLITIVTGHIGATCSYIREVHIRLMQKRIRATNKKRGVSFGIFLSLRILRRKKLILTLFSEFREKSQNLNINLSHEINSDIYLKTLSGKSLNPDNNFSILRR